MKREAFLPFLPLHLRSGSLFWPPRVLPDLKCLSQGPDRSHVDSGKLLAIAIADLRNALSYTPLSKYASEGFQLFFDSLVHEDAAAKWFSDVVPRLAGLLLDLPHLLEKHYANAFVDGVGAGLRLLEPQEPGIVLLSQKLIGALLACAFFCLFPTYSRGVKNLPTINFDSLFACLHDDYDDKVENKINCITHYFERICTSMPHGNVSFERKVLPSDYSRFDIFPSWDDFWSKSTISLCRFEVHGSGYIEDQSNEALEVDFANKYLGGGALHRGCVQEEIRFMINPELIAGMLFLPEMEYNEAIEIVGTERFSDYTGYAGSFRFCGDYVDQKQLDSCRRRKTRIVAIDALSNAGRRQYRPGFLLREINKAYCGFLDQHKVPQYKKKFQAKRRLNSMLDHEMDNCIHRSTSNLLSPGDSSTSSPRREKMFGDQRNCPINNDAEKRLPHLVDNRSEIGVATGNWGCGVFGGDPELKSIIQWLAASQASRPFILYYTFHLEALQRLDEIAQWIISQQWTVGELWDMLVEYASQKLQGDTQDGFFDWLLPPLHANNGMPQHDNNEEMELHGDQDVAMSPLDNSDSGDVSDNSEYHDKNNDMALHDDQDDSMSMLNDNTDDDVVEHGEDHDDISPPEDDNMAKLGSTFRHKRI